MFPRVIYHETLGQKVVPDEAVHKAHLEVGWRERPFPAKAPARIADPVGDRLAALEARVDALEAKKKR